MACLEKSKGRLGVIWPSMLNKVVLGKWLWIFSYECDCLLRKTNGEKYGEMAEGWCSTIDMEALLATCRRWSAKLENIFKWEPMFPSVMVEQENFRKMSCVGDEIKGLLFAFFTLAVHKDAWVLAYWEAGLGWQPVGIQDLEFLWLRVGDGGKFVPSEFGVHSGQLCW